MEPDYGISRSPRRGGAQLGRGRALATGPCRLEPATCPAGLGGYSVPARRIAAPRHPNVGGISARARRNPAGQGRPTCAATYREALDLANAIGDTAAQATCMFNLGHVCKNIADLRNLEEAERWYRESLDLRAPDDGFGKQDVDGRDKPGHDEGERWFNMTGSCPCGVVSAASAPPRAVCRAEAMASA
jgi:hypothetical protein